MSYQEGNLGFQPRLRIPMKAVKAYVNSKPGIQVGTKWEGKITRKADGSFEFDEDGINFLKQLGIEWVMVNDPPASTAAEFRRLREQIEEQGFKIFRLANNTLHNMQEITLNLEGRDRKIDEYLQYISNLGEAGIHYATYAHMGNGIWRDDIRRPVRGGATAGGLDLKIPNKGHWGGKLYEWPLSHGRRYSEEELWENYEYFIKKVKPVAEAADVYIGVHPDDPPAVEMAGIPRKIFGTFEGYKRALEIADSDHIGACLCVGCWLEGGAELCGTPEAFIRYFAASGRLPYLLADEPYREIAYNNIEVPPVLSAYSESIIVNSYSKSLSLPGERIGYIAVGPDIADKDDLMNGLIYATRILGYVNAPALMQRIVAELTFAAVDVSIYARRLAAFKEALDAAGISYAEPEGAFYLFCKAPPKKGTAGEVGDDRAFADHLKQYLILGVPGTGFGKPGWLRFAYCVDEKLIRASGAAFKKAMESW